MLDLTKLGQSNVKDSSLNPREIFQALPKTGSKFQYPRDVQTQIWNKWLARKDSSNLVVKMNTGGGKTIVGLMILKSCLNEGKGPAVYIVPDKYLVEQVIGEAASIGIDTTTDPKDFRYISGKSILVTNIYKLVNGKSVFGVGDDGVKLAIGSIVIDDAHACLDTVDQQFTMKISSDTTLYQEMTQIFSSALENHNPVKFAEIKSGDPSAFMQLPFWSWQKHQSQVTELMVAHKDNETIMFSYPLLKNHLLLSHCVFSASKIEISPHFIPISVIPALESAHRKIFMTATLADDSILSTHFGVAPDLLNEPITPDSAGDVGDRMILMPQVITPTTTDDDIKRLCVQVSKSHNVVVIVPSGYRAQYWDDVKQLSLSSENMKEGINMLKNQHVGLVVMVNRYDGVDLPQTACRLLVVDGLPDARNLIDKVKQSILMSTEYDIVEKIQRIEQGMGRGVRSSDDYCVVMLTGKQLTSAIYTGNALEHFSPATKAQIKLAEEITEQISGQPIDNLISVMDYCLTQNQGWVIASKDRLASLRYEERRDVAQIKLSLYDAYLHAIRTDYQKACSIINEAANKVSGAALQGYMKQQLAEYVNLHDESEAQRILLSANALNSRLMKPIKGISYKKFDSVTRSQAEQCSDYMNKFLIQNKMLISANGVLDDLQFVPDSSNRFEAAIHALAKLLGFQSQRPEADYNKGPDNLWSIGNQQYLVIECKNETITDTICKRDCNQLNGSALWFGQSYDFSSVCIPIMIHCSDTFEYASTPDPRVRVMTEVQLKELKNNARKFFESISQNNELNNVSAISEKLMAYRLRGEDIVKNYTVPFKQK